MTMFLVSLICPTTIPCDARHHGGSNTTMQSVANAAEDCLGENPIYGQHCGEITHDNDLAFA